MGQREYITNKYPFADITEEHAEEAAILWQQRNVVIHLANHDATSLTKLESRIDRHLNGIRLEPELSRFFVTEALQNFGGSGETFVAAVCAIESGEKTRVFQVLEHCESNSEEVCSGFVSALAWLPSQYSYPWIEHLIKSHKKTEKYIALASCGALRINPGEALRKILHSCDSSDQNLLFARALRVAAEVRRHDLAEWVKSVSSRIECSQPVYGWANWSAVMLGAQPCPERIKQLTEMKGEDRNLFLETSLRFCSPHIGRDLIEDMVRNNNIRDVINACSALGDPASIDWLIAQARQPTFARLAADAISTITGLMIPETSEPTGWSSQIEESEENDFLQECEESDYPLPWPSVNDLDKIWCANRAKFDNGRRYLWGLPIEQQGLHHIFGRGKQHRRRAAALELARIHPDSVFLNTCARINQCQR